MQYPHEYVQVSVTRRYVSNTYIPVFESHTRTREFESHTFQKLVYVFGTCTSIQKPSKVFLYVCTGFKYVLFQIRYTFKYVYFRIRILSNTYTFKYVYFQIKYVYFQIRILYLAAIACITRSCPCQASMRFSNVNSS